MRALVCALFLVFCANAALGFEGVPLLLWGNGKSLSPPALNSLASGRILSGRVAENQYTVVFVGDKLSPEALNECGAKNCFPYLENVEQKTYFANVENPIGLLATVGDDRKTEWVEAGAKLTAEAGKITFVTLSPGDFSTQDAEIEQMVKGLGDNADAVFIYTAKHNEVAEDNIVNRRIKREVANKQEEVMEEPIIFFRDNETFIIAYTEIAFVAPGATEPLLLNFTSATTAALNGTQESGLALDLHGEGPNLSFHILGEHGRWWVDKIMYDGKEYYLNTYIGTHIGFSFTCAPTSIFYSVEEQTPNPVFTKIHITRLQLEPRFTPEGTEGFTGFSDPWDCVGFVSPGILGGLFVVILLLVILVAGLSWIMEIRTMDRFDDIKGKTITINVNE
uniref:Putative vacuolar h+-atpase v0 sector accessory subunit s1 n=1 Tax=Nyssomyia neivai TaxID=330878 RepID=A0A1L8DF48_9DIPT